MRLIQTAYSQSLVSSLAEELERVRHLFARGADVALDYRVEFERELYEMTQQSGTASALPPPTDSAMLQSPSENGPPLAGATAQINNLSPDAPCRD